MAELRYGLTLFITGSTPRSLTAVSHVRNFCQHDLAGACDLEIVDLYEHPERARPVNVMVAPTLVRHEPKPVRLVFGDMSDRALLLSGIKND